LKRYWSYINSVYFAADNSLRPGNKLGDQLSALQMTAQSTLSAKPQKTSQFNAPQKQKKSAISKAETNE
jgi:hypothetical protein